MRRGVLYAISADGFLHALDLRTGAERAGWPIPITTGHSDAEYVWGGLRLLQNTLYVRSPRIATRQGPTAYSRTAGSSP